MTIVQRGYESFFQDQIINSENKTIIIKENNIIIAYAKYGKLEFQLIILHIQLMSCIGYMLIWKENIQELEAK